MKTRHEGDHRPSHWREMWAVFESGGAVEVCTGAAAGMLERLVASSRQPFDSTDALVRAARTRPASDRV
jgi:hypothetical protein